MLGDPFVRDCWSAVSRTWHRLLVSSIPAMALMFRASRSRAFQSRAFQPRALLSRVALTGLVVTGAILAASVLAACGNSQKVETPAEYEAWLKTQNEGKPDQPKGADEYIIGAGNSLSVFVWHNADLSEGGVQVRPDGRISVPLINEIDAAGKTPPQLAAEIEERLKKYVQDPLVSVIVRSFVGPLDRQNPGDRRGHRPAVDPVSRRHDGARPDDRDQGPDEIRRRQSGDSGPARPRRQDPQHRPAPR